MHVVPPSDHEDNKAIAMELADTGIPVVTGVVAALKALSAALRDPYALTGTEVAAALDVHVRSLETVAALLERWDAAKHDH